MDLTCLWPRNNEKACNGAGTPITGSSNLAGQRVPTNTTAAICNQAFIQGDTAGTLASTGAAYDSGSVTCAPATDGYLYFQNNCPAGAATADANATTSVFSIQASTRALPFSSFDFFWLCTLLT